MRLDKDGNLVLPDFSGNNFFQSIGNISSDGLAGIVVPNFDSGDLLYITGSARNLFGKAAQEIMPRIDRLTVIAITGYCVSKAVLDLDTSCPTLSPYDPPIRPLATELSNIQPQEDIPVIVENVVRTSQATSTFTFSLPQHMTVSAKPGQHAILDFSSERPPWQHMNGKLMTIEVDSNRRLQPTTAQ